MRTEQSANKRGIEFDLSFGKLKQVLNSKKCYFTGRPLVYDDPEHEDYLTLDRVDASIGYIDSNIVACGRAFNLRKGDVSAEDIILMYKGLQKKKLI